MSIWMKTVEHDSLGDLPITIQKDRANIQITDIFAIIEFRDDSIDFSNLVIQGRISGSLPRQEANKQDPTLRKFPAEQFDNLCDASGCPLGLFISALTDVVGSNLEDN